MTRGIFLTVKDLMKITGIQNYEAARQLHQAVRDSIGPNKRKLTIKEYCKHEGLDYKEIIEFLKKD